jgi:hypothetical protein
MKIITELMGIGIFPKPTSERFKDSCWECLLTFSMDQHNMNSGMNPYINGLLRQYSNARHAVDYLMLQIYVSEAI